MPLILPGNVASATASTTYTVDNSCRFDGTNDYMVRSATGSSTESNNKWTFSCWVKRAKLGAEQMMMDHRGDGNQFNIRFLNDDSIQAYDYVGSALLQRATNALYRDPSAWMHILWSSDRSIASPTTKLWVNGTEVTSWATSTEYSQDDTAAANQDYDTWIGGENSSGSRLGGYLAEVVWLDGTFVSDATDFGEFDEDSPTIWKPKDVSGLTFGTNGFYFDFKASDNLGNDANGGTDFTETGLDATDQATDTPTNNFATLNPLLDVNNPPTFSEGNLEAQGSSSGKARLSGSTICVSNGKWYYEVKVTTGSSSPYVGVIDAQSYIRRHETYFVGSDIDTDNPSGFAVNMSGDIYHNNSNSYAVNIGSISTDDILGFKIDMDASPKTCEILKNGSSERTFNLDEPPSGFYMLGCISIYNQAGAIGEINYGSPSFTISSGNADGNGYGNFEYAVPSGYYALCTKNLAEYG